MSPRVLTYEVLEMKKRPTESRSVTLTLKGVLPLKIDETYIYEKSIFINFFKHVR